MLFIVYRVNWLRARARYYRWKEEITLLEHEMQWVCLYFKWKSRQWEGFRLRANQEGLDGHEAYAYGQVDIWHGMAVRAEMAFRKVWLAFELPEPPNE